MQTPLSQDALNQIFLEARSHNTWLDKDVPDELLVQAWDNARWGPTSMNCCPLRITFVKSAEQKEKLRNCLSEGNVDKTMKAPVTAILATDMEFYVNMPKLFPGFPGAADMFESTPELSDETAFRNATLQAAYFLISCRTLGLSCGPMSGFDNQKLDETFFNNSKLKSNFLLNIGYGDIAGVYERECRPAFDEACKIL